MKPYEEVIEFWVREFIDSMDEGVLRAGNQSGMEPLGVKIIFDGYGDLDTENEYIEGGNHEMLSFAVFVHKDSLNGQEFPEHDQTPWALIHRPKEEVCIWVWYNKAIDEIEIVPFEDGSTELEHSLVYQLIHDLDEGNYSNM